MHDLHENGAALTKLKADRNVTVEEQCEHDMKEEDGQPLFCQNPKGDEWITTDWRGPTFATDWKRSIQKVKQGRGRPRI